MHDVDAMVVQREARSKQIGKLRVARTLTYLARSNNYVGRSTVRTRRRELLSLEGVSVT